MRPKNVTEDELSKPFYSGTNATDEYMKETPSKEPFRGATSKCKIFTVGDDGQRYSFDIESDQSFNDCFSECKVESDFKFDNEEEFDFYMKTYVNSPVHRNEHYNPLEYYNTIDKKRRETDDGIVPQTSSEAIKHFAINTKIKYKDFSRSFFLPFSRHCHLYFGIFLTCGLFGHETLRFKKK